MNTIKITTLMIFLVITTSTHAKEAKRFYVGGSLGSSNIDTSDYEKSLKASIANQKAVANANVVAADNAAAAAAVVNDANGNPANAAAVADANAVAAVAAGVAAAIAGLKYDIDDSYLGWKLFAGYKLNRYFGIETSYVDLGEMSVDITAPGEKKRELGFKANGFVFSGIGTYPVNEKFDLFGKVGVFVWNWEVSSSGKKSSEDDSDGTDIMFGFGAEYEIKDNIGIRAEWERFNFDKDEKLETHVDFYSIGLTYRF